MLKRWLLLGSWITSSWELFSRETKHIINGLELSTTRLQEEELEVRFNNVAKDLLNHAYVVKL